jgi:hypothetical protein
LRARAFRQVLRRGVRHPRRNTEPELSRDARTARVHPPVRKDAAALGSSVNRINSTNMLVSSCR